MSPPDRRQQTFMAIASVVAVSGMAIHHWLDARRTERDLERVRLLLDRSNTDQARYERELEAMQRKLGCKGAVTMGVCMDPPCVDSDVTAPDDPHYVRGSVTFFAPMGPHQTVFDTCVGATDLREGVCVGDHPEWQVIHCEKGCRDGVCLR